MKNFLKMLGVFAILLLMTAAARAQLGLSKTDIIKNKGYSYESDITNDGVPYIFYSSTAYSRSGSSYSKTEAFYFNSNNYCTSTMVIEPSAEANEWVLYLNSKYVRETTYEWRDYEKNIVCYMEVKEGSVVLRFQYFE